MEKYRILCVDDDITMLNSLEDILMAAGYEVSLSKSGAQALKILERKIPCDLILLDVEMPDMDGYETLEKIQGIKGCEEIPVIFLTGIDAPDFEIRGLEIGAADYIVKPFIKSVLLARIKGQLRKASRVLNTESPVPDMPEAFAQELNNSEQMIARYIAQGLSNQEIADETHYSYNYVKKVTSSILSKLNLTKRSEIRQMLKGKQS